MDSTIMVAIIGGIFGLAGTVIGIISTAKRKEQHEDQALRDGVQSLLRIKIINIYEECVNANYCSLEKREALKRMYAAYHDLGGNDVATDLYHKTLELPTKPPVNPKRRKDDYE